MDELQNSNNTQGDIEMEHTFELFSIVLLLCCIGSGLCKSVNDKVNQYCESKRNPFPFYAKRYAAKEALSKALGTGIRKNIHFKNIEISNDNFGKPSISLKGDTVTFLQKKIKNKKFNIYLSLSDDDPWAQATVIISYN